MDQGNENAPQNQSEIANEPDFSQYSKEYRVLGTGTYWSEYEQARFEHAIGVASPKILKALEEGPLFARWSPDIELDKTPGKVSQTVAARTLGLKPTDEAGISVNLVDKKDPNLGLNLRYSMAGRYGYRPRKLHILKGTPVAHGHDGELVLESSSIQELLTIPYESKILEDFPELRYYNPYT